MKSENKSDKPHRPFLIHSDTVDSAHKHWAKSVKVYGQPFKHSNQLIVWIAYQQLPQ